MSLADYIGKYWAGAEAIYAVIIAMTFTSILRSYTGIPDEAYFNIIYSALFCCIAWGIADGSFYVWERRYNIRMENDIIDLSKSDSKNEEAIPLIREQLDDTILRNIDEDKRLELYQKLMQYLAVAGKKEMVSTKDALDIILGTFMVSTAAGIIVVLPFFLADNLRFALSISNWLGISLLFIIGYFRTHEQRLFSRVISGFSTAVIGIIIAVITVLLGG